VICHSFEEERIRRSSTVTDVRTWEEDENPFELSGRCFRELRMPSSTILLDGNMPFNFYFRLQTVMPQFEFVDGSPLMFAARITKSAEEITLLRRASSFTAEGILAGIEEVSPGMKESEIAQIVNEQMSKRSGEPASCLVQSGPNSAIPHGSASDRKIEPNDVLLIDGGTFVSGYKGDITITTVIGEPSARFKKIYDIVYRANRAAFDAARPGVPCENLDKIARDLIVSEGFGQYFTHRLGHGIGLEGHEHPYLVNGNTQKLETGMAFTIEPGIYILGEFGIRIEDDVAITEDGAERLSTVPRDL
jgi:Xaa-Pro dipeptidase